MKKQIISMCIFMFIRTLSGCSKPGDDFVGYWINTKKENDFIEITKNGDAFIVNHISPSFFSGLIEANKLPGTIQDGILHVKTGMSAVNMAIDKSSGNIFVEDEEYKKVTSDAQKKQIQHQIEEYNKNKKEKNRNRFDYKKATPSPEPWNKNSGNKQN